MRETIYEARWEELLPQPLREDKKVMALVQAMSEQRRTAAAQIAMARFWTDMELLPENMLDVLAYDLKIDWWDESYPAERKRQILRESILVHKHKGTKYAVETATSSMYPKTQVEEWFAYGGEPYTFRLNIDVTDEEVTTEKHRQLLERVNYYKNARSHLDQVTYMLNPVPAVARCGAAFVGGYMAMTVNIRAREAIEKPHIGVPVYAGISAGIYQKIITEVAVNGLD